MVEGKAGKPDDATAAGDVETVTVAPRPFRAAAAAADAVAAASFPRGTQVARYTILEQLGRGGMGVVYSAYDSELDRRVALKFLSVRAEGTSQTAEARVRLLREAQAMARVSHPNVVSVYEIGTYEENVYMAMELVEGATLADWLAKKPPSREILDVFLQAGRGLAAAHRAGLVHRDFKPANTLVGADGRVRVTDFGVARMAMSIEGASTGPKGLLSVTMTQAGAIVGTLTYMAPEQMAGSTADEKSDQFAFCVALYRALCGRRPYELAALEQYAQQKPRGTPAPLLQAPDPNVRVRPKLLRALRRGLSLGPAGRFASMDDLLDALERAGSTRRLGLLLAASAIAIGGIAISIAVTTRDRVNACSGAERELARAWDPAARLRVQRAFSTSTVSYAPSIVTEVVRGLDEHGRRWSEIRTDACRAARVRHERSEADLGLQIDCLDRELDATSALVHVLERPDATTVSRALDAVATLSAERCRDVAALRAVVPPPSGAKRQAVAAVQKRLADVRALRAAGATRAAFDKGSELVAESVGLGYAPLIAETTIELGRAQARVDRIGEAERSYHDAIEAAELGHHDEARAEAAIELVTLVGYTQRRYEEGQRWARFATAILGRLGGRPLLSARLLNNRMGMLFAQGRYADVAAGADDLLRATELASGKEHQQVVSVHNNLALAFLAAGDVERAKQHLTIAIEMAPRVGVGEAPIAAFLALTMARVLEREGKTAEALAQASRAIELMGRMFGFDHHETREAGIFRAGLRVAAGQTAAGIAELQQLTRDLRAADAGPSLATALEVLATALADTGHHAEALEHFVESIAVRERLEGHQQPSLASAWMGAGRCQLALGHTDEAIAALERARELSASGGVPAELAAIDDLLARARRVNAARGRR